MAVLNGKTVVHSASLLNNKIYGCTLLYHNETNSLPSTHITTDAVAIKLWPGK